MSPAGAAADDRPVVLRVSGPTASVWADGEEVEARVVPGLPGGPPVAGDRVEMRAGGERPALVGIAPRRTLLVRGQGPDRTPRPLAANADLLIVVSSVVRPAMRPTLIDRYLVVAELGSLAPALLVTKADLPHDERELRAVLARYEAVGYPAVVGSAKDPALVGRVRELIGDRTAVLAGPSGVGKSTLTRALTGVERAVGAVSRKAGTGRHTTTDPRLIPIPGGGAVVDTAGVRTFHLPRLSREELEAGFPEIAQAAGGCRFRGCAHDGDAGCAVPGRVSAERLDSYRRILHDMR
ncbi:MAG TPA: ribosome small subunit-dependent GTPase A [Miltoncostaeaceae bacterium]|nr:ribosome small subunit-dependent GTPase A [Miltoncostaeaceae bacterium]